MLTGNGNLLLYDNGNECREDPHTRQTISRTNNVFSRVVEYVIDKRAGQLRFVRHHSLGSTFDAFTPWTGLVEAMDNGNWLISWGGEGRYNHPERSITEVEPATNRELLHIYYEDANGSRRWTRSYPLRHDEWAPPVPALTATSHVVAPTAARHGRTSG